MIGGIAVMLIMTFGLSRLLLNVLPKAIDERAKALWANLGALLVIGAIYAATAASESDGFTLVALGLAFAAPCQALWYWRDVSKLAPTIAHGTIAGMSSPAAGMSSPAAASYVGERAPPRPEARTADRHERWHALVRYDADVAAAADRLRPFGEKWLEELGRSYFALNEDKQYLPTIVGRLSEEAAAERAATWVAKYQRVFNGALSTSSLDILREAEKAGYRVEVEGNAIAISKDTGRSFLYSEEDVQRHRRFLRP
jgi:hypothetical protein